MIVQFIFCFFFLALLILPISYIASNKKGLLVGLILVLLMSLSTSFDVYYKEKQYNNGICLDCGGDYVFVNATKNRYGSTVKFYECKNCQKVIEQY